MSSHSIEAAASRADNVASGTSVPETPAAGSQRSSVGSVAVKTRDDSGEAQSTTAVPAKPSMDSSASIARAKAAQALARAIANQQVRAAEPVSGRERTQAAGQQQRRERNEMAGRSHAAELPSALDSQASVSSAGPTPADAPGQTQMASEQGASVTAPSGHQPAADPDEDVVASQRPSADQQSVVDAEAASRDNKSAASSQQPAAQSKDAAAGRASSQHLPLPASESSASTAVLAPSESRESRTLTGVTHDTGIESHAAGGGATAGSAAEGLGAAGQVQEDALVSLGRSTAADARTVLQPMPAVTAVPETVSLQTAVFALDDMDAVSVGGAGPGAAGRHSSFVPEAVETLAVAPSGGIGGEVLQPASDADLAQDMVADAREGRGVWEYALWTAAFDAPPLRGFAFEACPAADLAFIAVRCD